MKNIGYMFNVGYVNEKYLFVHVQFAKIYVRLLKNNIAHNTKGA